MNSISAWWCNVPILKNDGVKVHGFRMTSLFYEMEHKRVMIETTNQNIYIYIYIHIDLL